MSNMVLAYHTVSRGKREVPEAWLSDTGPFPGQWRPAPSTLESLGYETEYVEEAEMSEGIEIPEANVAGVDSEPSAAPAASGEKSAGDQPAEKTKSVSKTASK